MTIQLTKQRKLLTGDLITEDPITEDLITGDPITDYLQPDHNPDKVEIKIENGMAQPIIDYYKNNVDDNYIKGD